MNRRQAAVLAAFLFLPAIVWIGRAEPSDDIVLIQRDLMNLRLGNRLRQIQILYSPARNWPTYREPKGALTRIIVKRGYAGHFPEDVETLRLGLRHDRLAHIQAIFDAEHTRKQPLERLVVELSTMYGEPRRHGMAYLWTDGRTVMMASNAEVPAPDGNGIELRASLEIMERDLYEP